MSNNEFTTKEEQPSQDAAQPQKAAPANKWAQDAMHPEKALFRTWLLVRPASPSASSCRCSPQTA